MPEYRSNDISQLLRRAEARGFTHNFAIEDEALCCHESGERFEPGDARIVWSQAVDMGTDPGDDATLYLIETSTGDKGYMVLANSFYVDPRKAAFIDSIARDQADRSPL